MPLVAIVATSLLDEVECEGFIEIVDELLSMTEIVLEAPSIAHIFGFTCVIAKFVIGFPKDERRVDGIIILFSEKIFKILLISLVVHDSFCPAADIFSVMLKKIHLLLELVWMPDVIMILDSDIVSPRLF